MNEVERAQCLALRRTILEREFAGMNGMQRQAVFCVKGPLLVLAGAGSGKTTVLVHRIAYLIRHGNAWHSGDFACAPDAAALEDLRTAAEGDAQARERIAPLLCVGAPEPWRILAITFTNKAAGEMKERLRTMLGDQAGALWAGTFHSVCAKILRRHDGGLPGYDAHFAIYDTDDSRRAMKEVQRQLQMDEKFLPHRQLLSAVSRAKERLVSPEALAGEAGSDLRLRQTAQAYARYQQLLRKANAMDFDDIITNTVELLEGNALVRRQYQQRFEYILVDEYQDTNFAQDRLVQLLSAGHGNLCAVGDDDQSIYSFRGAAVENILYFERQFSGAQVIRLEQNYRSTQAILDAANAVIAHNRQRKGKSLWTGNGEGVPPAWRVAEDERAEARLIAEQIEKSVAAGRQWGDHAVLYRVNALSNTLETAFVRAGIPYRIIGGHRFYDRKEIKDALAYLTVLVNPADEIRLRRIINEPKRGIGEATVQSAAALAVQEGVSLYQILLRAKEYPQLRRAAARLGEFTGMLEELRALRTQMTMKALLELTMQRSGYIAALAQDRETYEDRMENLQELSSNLLRYEEEAEEASLWGFLEEVALLSDIDQYNAQADAAVLMTLHAAKGLEFPCVFLPAWEERVFPGYQVLFGGAESALEEERRLAYVGITRARETLCFTTARSRLLYGSTAYNSPSRFLREAGLAEPEGGEKQRTAAIPLWGQGPRQETGSLRKSLTEPKPDLQPPTPVFAPGERVRHSSFGEGSILSCRGIGNDHLLEVAFDTAGQKKLMAKYAKLERLGS
ncbi:MAG: UvrD-helicase domain-containing protein [Oscillospiraceae bacterium]|jgi:DNA helicase-2/ATP-dependent DNA helicase PcrA|nr:UvrD-helicase domain-containing protein [Oscillospiraceae bacterium]